MNAQRTTTMMKPKILPMLFSDVGKEMLTQEQWKVMAQSFRLTARERQVCEQLFDGSTRNEIAESLGIKPRTVRHYMENIHGKLSVRNRVAVVLRIVENRDRQIAANSRPPSEENEDGPAG